MHVAGRELIFNWDARRFFPLASIFGTGLHLELDTEATLCFFSTFVVSRRDSAVSVNNPHFEQFLLAFSLLLSFFVGDLLTRCESPATGDLGFVVLDVYHGREGEKVDKCILLLCGSKFGLSACPYDKYSTRYEFLNIFEGFLSRFCHSGLRRLTRSLTPLP
jgi:hypothetical protein